jgi:DNA-binding LacI/PurR family transcriptional regulator
LPRLQQKKKKIDSVLTMEHIASIAGVSTITVSRALRDSPLVKEKTREKIRQIAEQEGYRFNISARNLRLRSSHSVAVVIEVMPAKDQPLSGSYPLDLLGGIMQTLNSAGYSVVLTSKQLIHTPPVQGADGIILLGQGSHGEAVRQIQACKLPLVVWGAQLKEFPCVVVGSDNRAGGSNVAYRFLEQGRKKLIFLGDIDHAEIEQRYAGFIETLGVTGKQVTLVRPGAFTFEAGFDSISKLLKKPGTSFNGIFAVSDALAMGAIRAVTEHGLQVPSDVSVTGYDDTPSAASFVPPLTSVHQYLHDGGALLADKMLAMIRGETVSSEMLPTSLIVRQT